MRLAIIADAYPPLRSSGAVQLRDLSVELAQQGHRVTMLVASDGIPGQWMVEESDGVRVIRFRVPKTKDTGLLRRAVGEALMPLIMLKRLRSSPIAREKWDGVVWYSPTIFLGLVAQALRSKSGCRSYLIIRDIFPEWAVDMGLMGRGFPYFFFRAVANYQYSVADALGVQSPGNCTYFSHWARKPGRRLEVLHNWLAPIRPVDCSITLASTPIAGRKVFVYAGNIGIAQGMGVLVELAERLRARRDIGFVFVGRGSALDQVKEDVRRRRLENVVIFDEIAPGEIPGLYAQCSVGLLALDPRHRSHNIPGKFLSYMQCGLPVIATVNPGNDIVELIRTERVGVACVDGSPAVLAQQSEQLLEDLRADVAYPARCEDLARRMFSVERAARQITAALAM